MIDLVVNNNHFEGCLSRRRLFNIDLTSYNHSVLGVPICFIYEYLSTNNYCVGL